jgi:hypothetical protein
MDDGPSGWRQQNRKLINSLTEGKFTTVVMWFQIQEVEDYFASDLTDDEVSAALGVEALIVDVVAVQGEAAACLG